MTRGKGKRRKKEKRKGREKEEKRRRKVNPINCIEISICTVDRRIC